MLFLKEIQSFRKVDHRVHRAGENMTNFFFNLGVKQLLQMIVITTTIISLWQKDVHFYISLKYIGKLGGGRPVNPCSSNLALTLRFFYLAPPFLIKLNVWERPRQAEGQCINWRNPEMCQPVPVYINTCMRFINMLMHRLCMLHAIIVSLRIRKEYSSEQTAFQILKFPILVKGAPWKTCLVSPLPPQGFRMCSTHWCFAIGRKYFRGVRMK